MKKVLVDGSVVKPGHELREGEHVRVEFVKEHADLTPADDILLDIIYEDDVLIVINKPAGLTVHPGKGSAGDTLVNALIHHTRSLSARDSSERPGIVHRLDKNTSGLLVVAKDDRTHQRLQKQFTNKTIRREYRALVWGRMTGQEGRIETRLSRSRREPTKMAVSREGRIAITDFRVLQDFHYVSLLSLSLATGRTHQIRVHMNHIHHPVVGDPDYNGRDSQLKQLPVNLRKRGMRLLEMVPSQFLHAKILEFIHPVHKETMRFEAPLPDNLQEALDKIPHLFMLSDMRSGQ